MKFLLTVLLFLTLTACGGPQTDPGEALVPQPDQSTPVQVPVDVPFALAAYPAHSFHPALGQNRANLTLAPLLYEPLFQVDETFQAAPVLCESYAASADGLTWTFTLRPNITFSDGTPLTGENVAAALEVARQEGSRYAQRLSNVSLITAVEGTVTIHLRRPNGELPLLLDIPIALDRSDRAAGTGPYALTETEEGLFLTARADWWQNQQLPQESIPIKEARQSDDLLSSFAAGDVGLVDVDLMGTNALGYSGNYETWDYATTDFLYLGFNTKSGPCQYPQVRQALARAVDRNAIAQIDFANHAVPTQHPLHPDSPLYMEGLTGPLSYDPEVLADETVQRRLKNRTLVLLVNSENTAKAAAAQRIADQLESAGVSVTLSKLPFEDYTAALKAGSFDLYLGETVLTADFDLTHLLSSAGTLNYGRWQDSQTDALLTAYQASGGVDRRTAAGALFNHLNDQVPLVPICFKNGSVLTQWGRLTGLSPVRGNIFNQLESWTIR